MADLTLTCANCHKEMVVSVPADPDSLLDFSMQAASLTDRYSAIADSAVKAMQVVEARLHALEGAFLSIAGPRYDHIEYEADGTPFPVPARRGVDR